jgi:DNA polymerase III sliding clamp (beta) subunit (PCNA family)
MLTLYIGERYAWGDEVEAACIKARDLRDSLKGFPKGDMKLSLSPDRLTITSGDVAIEVPGMHISEWPDYWDYRMGQSGPLTDVVSLPAVDLQASLERVMWAISNDKERPIQSNILFHFKGDTLALVATNGHVLVVEELPLAQPATSPEMLVPAATLAKMLPLLKQAESITISANKSMINFSAPKWDMVSILTEGQFPRYDVILANISKPTLTVTVDTDSLRGVLQIARPYASENNNITYFEIQDNMLSIRAGLGLNTYISKIYAKVTGGWRAPVIDESAFELAKGHNRKPDPALGPLEWAFDINYILQIVTSATESHIVISGQHPNRAFLIEGGKMLAGLMPMNIIR